MNKIIYLLLITITGCLYSCYDDKSKDPNREIPSVTITSEDILEAAYGKELTVTPIIKKGNDEKANLSYSWQINLIPRQSELIEISQEANLVYEVVNEPNSNPYLLVLKVTDNDEGIDYYKKWDLYVSNSVGEGLLVAHTSDGGSTSDLTFVKAPQVSFGYNGEVDYTRNVYSFANGANIDGKVNSIVANLASNGPAYNTSRLLIGTNKSIFSLDPATFNITKTNEELFFQPPVNYNIETISTVIGNCLVTVVEGKAYGVVCNMSYQFSSPMNYASGSRQVFTSKLALEKNTALTTAVITCYDETNGYFIYAPSLMTFNNGSSAILTQMLEDGQYVFDPGNLPNKKAIAAGLGNNSEHMHWLRDLSTQKDTIYKLSAIDYTVGGTGMIDMSQCQETNQAIDYVFCENMDVMYYATNNKIYPVIFAGNTARNGAAWSLPSNEEHITHIQMYQQAWYGNATYASDSYNYVNAQHQKQLLVTTYNSSTGEGKIYIVPITAQGSGTLGTATQTLNGFGEITAIGTTLR